MDDKTTQERILDTAASLFGAKGFYAVSTTDIAREAGVNKALIFYYFSSKEDLYHAVIKSRLEIFKRRIEELSENTEPGLPMIETFVRAHIAFFGENQMIIKMLAREFLSHDQDANADELPFLKELADTLKPIRDRMLSTIDYAREKGEIRDVDPIHTMVNILSLNVFFFLGHPLIKVVAPLYKTEEFQAKRVDHVIDLLMNGLKIHNPETSR